MVNDKAFKNEVDDLAEICDKVEKSVKGDLRVDFDITWAGVTIVEISEVGEDPEDWEPVEYKRFGKVTEASLWLTERYLEA